MRLDANALRPSSKLPNDLAQFHETQAPVESKFLAQLGSADENGSQKAGWQEKEHPL